MNGENIGTEAEAEENPRETDPDLPSCDSCRKRKSRCSREYPACSSCTRLDLRCTYEYQRKKPGLKSGTVEALARRVELLETRLNTNICNDNHQPSSSVAAPPQDTYQNGRPSDEAIGSTALNLLIQELHRLNSNLTNSLNQRHIPIVSTPSSPAILPNHGPRSGLHGPNTKKRARIDDHTQSTESLLQTTRQPQVVEHHSRDAASSSTHLLQNQTFLEALLDAYYDNIHPWIPILQEDQSRIRLLDTNKYRQNIVILQAIFTAACRFIQDEAFPAQNMTQLAESARDFVILHAMSDLTLTNLQALIIIAFIDLGDGKTSKAWSLIGSLTRTVQYLHLSVEDADADERRALLPDLPKLPNPGNWIESEERRRVFWCIFLLDRFCSITTGWNVSLTANDVCRRLPVDGGVWRRGVPTLTPYFGIWDNKAAKIGNTITFLPSKYDGVGQISDRASSDGSEITGPSPGSTSVPVEPLKVGAFSYCIEAVESLSRINTHFLQQKINFSDREEVSSWLTRFKELDLRLVHWKMFLPQKWKNPNNTPNPVTAALMDPNMTLAHVVHNVSSILLHQRIAYPSDEIKHLRLPSACSADTCFTAAIETSKITVKYLKQSIVTQAMAPLFSICIFTSAKVLLVHAQYCKEALAPEFWTLVECLETMGRTWKGRLVMINDPPSTMAETLAHQLRALHGRYEERLGDPVALFMQPATLLEQPSINTSRQAHQSSIPSPGMQLASRKGVDDSPYGQANTAFGGADGDVECAQQATMMSANMDSQADTSGLPHQTRGLTLDDISAGLMDQGFLHRDRIINYDDFVFNTDLWGSNDIPDL